MSINFCFDHIINPESFLVLPNLCRLDVNISVHDFTQQRGQLSTTFPFCDYPRLIEYALSEQVPFTISTVDQAPVGSFYIIDINFFVKTLDYFSLLPHSVLAAIKQKRIKILFYYNEADAPKYICQRLWTLCEVHAIDSTQVYFVSHNTSADGIKNFFYFNDDEILYHRTCQQFLTPGVSFWHNDPRSKKTTALVRTHKNWRAVFCAQLDKMNWSEHSWLSYCDNNNGDNQDLLECTFKPELKKNPSRAVDPNNTWLDDTVEFLKTTPVLVDDLDNQIRNQYQTFVAKLFLDSYWNIVIETHISIEYLPGVFLTEKTWKAIAHFQPFVIMGCAGSLAHLRELGYKTFGDYIDESYDEIQDDVQRARKVLSVCGWLASLTHQELQQLHERIKPAVIHNRNLFWSSKKSRVQTLFERIQHSG
jgi:hypothetical protein